MIQLNASTRLKAASTYRANETDAEEQKSTEATNHMSVNKLEASVKPSAIKLGAATRLAAAKAEPKKARAYLRSLGVAATELLGEEDGYIGFAIAAGKHKDAVKALSKQFGKPRKSLDPNRDEYEWKIPGKGKIRIAGVALRKGHGPYGVYMYDRSFGAAARLKAASFTMHPWAEAMFKHLKRFDLDPGPGGMGSSDGDWVDQDVGDEIKKALKGFKNSKDRYGTVSFYSATNPKCGVSLYWDEDEDMYQIFWFDNSQ